VEEVVDRRYPASVKRHVRRQGAVPWIAEARIRGHYTERESCVGGDGNQRGKDVVVLDPGYERGFWHDGGHHAIGIVTGPHGPAVPHGRDFVRQVEEPAGQPDASADCHRHA
jgi:hypothetical protein